MISEQHNPSVVLRITSGMPDGLPDEDLLEELLSKALEHVLGEMDISWRKRAIELSVTLTDDIEIRALNLEHRDMDAATDVLSFPLLSRGESPEKWSKDESPVVLGDVVVSVQTIARQADERGILLLERFSECLVHGVMHLLGWDHSSDQTRKRMEAMEDGLISGVQSILAVGRSGAKSDQLG